MKRYFKVEKLIREKISKNFLDCIQKRRILNDNEYFFELKKKIIEESEEVFLAKNREEFISEIADLYEVIDCFLKFEKIKKNEIKNKMKEKKEERGSFDKKIYCEYVEVPIKSKAIKYYLDNNKKYPEIYNL